MKYQNPIIQGFYPDPSVCFANGKYYLVCSSFHYFPGVPLFESNDLVNWKQIGHCLTRKSQIALANVNSSGGVFAPTIRYHEGRFFMTTTNDTTHQHFYVWTDDIYGEWSESIFVDQNGIDPSLYFENGRIYFMSNGSDDQGVGGIVQCEIDSLTGKKLTPSRTIWQGTGGRYLESPHLYKINGYYYLVAAEGGTEYGHMVTYARGISPYGPFEAYMNNPVLTNRNLGGFAIQGVGHGDLIQGPDESYWMLHLGFRQTGQYDTFHHLGREVFLTPIYFHEDGWFTAGENGTTKEYVDVPHASISQQRKFEYNFKNTDWNMDWCYLRHPDYDNYLFTENKLTLFGTNLSLNDVDSPTFLGLRQKDFGAKISCDITMDQGEAGITIFMDENHHYDLAIVKTPEGYKVIERLCIGNIKSIEGSYDLGSSPKARLLIDSENQEYTFFVEANNGLHKLGYGLTRYLSSEVAGGFTGVLIGLYAHSEDEPNKADFSNFSCVYLAK
jgi:alpha-N-arabinofuranosidase